MPRPSRKKKGAKASGRAQASPPLDPLRRGMPAQDSIIGVKDVKLGGNAYRIIKTTETDDYDPPLTKEPRKRSR